ncbi:hypothetical protein [Mycobacteroides abscessus]|uniref:hypothetical protein n=1 Tax=Mycobacteroides abscessus TaxID=36809 RepID=UPI002105EEBD|nr:hypothetical protein [Mycobacteroides abscessus]
MNVFVAGAACSRAQQRLASYLTATGWQRPDAEGPDGALWKHPESPWLLAVPHEVDASSAEFERLLAQLATLEGLPTTEIVARLEDYR